MMVTSLNSTLMELLFFAVLNCMQKWQRNLKKSHFFNDAHNYEYVPLHFFWDK